MKKIIILLCCVLIASCDFIQKKNKQTALEQKPLPNANTLREKAIKTLAEKLTFKDTLYVITSMQFGICGNDDRFNENQKPSKEEIEAHKKYVKANPYFIEETPDNQYKEVTQVNGKTILTGSSFELKNIQINNQTKELKKIKKPIYFLNLEVKHKDTVEATVSEVYLEGEKKFKLIRNNTSWNVN